MSEVVVVTKRPTVAGRAVVGPAYATIPMPVTIYDMARVRSDPSHSLYVIPFGPARGMIVLRNLKRLTWKGRKGPAFWEHIKSANPRVAEGLKKAIAISKAYAGIRGVTFIDGIPYPTKAIKQKDWRAEKASQVESIARTLGY